jgi:hypothetical protein
MRILLSLIFLLTSAVPAAAAGTVIADSIGARATEDGRLAKRKKKKKKKKKGKKGQEEETPAPPPPDADGDGVPDEIDQCVDEAEDKDGYEDEDGCPDPDNDGDGIADGDDQCPDEAENKDGWDDDDGCPEPPPAISPMMFDATLVDGTKVTGKLIRIIAVDEDSEKPEPFEPAEFGIIVNDVDEFNTPWNNLRSLSAAKVKFSDSVDCYSEGSPDLGETTTWECTLKHPTTLKLAESEFKGAHKSSDNKMHRYDLKIDEMTCDGASCEKVEADRGLSIYLYKLLAFVNLDDEYAAVKSLQDRLREMQKVQIRKATFKPVE